MTTTAEALALAVQYHQAGNLAQAERIYRQILQADPANPSALHLLGMVAHQVGQPETALGLIRQAVAVNPHAAEFHANLAAVYVALGRWEEAVASCRQALRCQPGSPKAHNSLGSIFMQMGRLQEAAASFREALRLRPGYAEAHNNLGLALAAQGQVEDAMASYREALRLRPELPEPHYNLGNACQTQGRSVEAIACFEQALGLRPDYAEAHNKVGLVLAAQGRLAEAAGRFREALRLQPDMAEAHNNLGFVLAGQGNQDEALACYKQAVRIQLDAALAKQGPLAEALNRLRAALRLGPDYPRALTHLGTALAEQGQFAEALDSLREALRLEPGLSEAHYNLGLVLAWQGKRDEALASYEQAVWIKPDYAEALHKLGTALAGQGRLEEAQASYREALRLEPDLREARYTIWIVSPRGSSQTRCFEEIALALRDGLRELGHKSEVVTGAPLATSGEEEHVIVLGANFLSATPFVIPRSWVIYNLEQISEGSPRLTADYIDLLKSNPVWDYCQSNIDALARLGLTARRCGIGYVQALTRIEDFTSLDQRSKRGSGGGSNIIDVLMYGALNERRAHVLQGLQAEDVHVVHACDCYGSKRDALIARSKVVLNVHFYEAKIFEIARCSYLLANRKCVVSEWGNDRELEEPFREGIVFCRYEDLVAQCVSYLGNDAARDLVASRGFAVFSKMSQAEMLRKVL